ncbi:MAG: dTDP-4-dehydrorhamnose 3,5-epimerase [Nitrospira sp.]|nr:dTDP-4-dehydrorhamnose 3,5-epimerase [Nitrospira sp.]
MSKIITCSSKHVLKGLHDQIKQPQGKLIRVVAGAVFDVTLDIRKRSPTFGRWVGELLSADNKKQLWIPEGLAHGFVVLSEQAEMLYKTTGYWAPEHERCIVWNDATVGIEWPIEGSPETVRKRRTRCGLLIGGSVHVRPWQGAGTPHRRNRPDVDGLVQYESFAVLTPESGCGACPAA